MTTTTDAPTPAAEISPAAEPTPAAPIGVNRVLLQGRISAINEPRILPSGDQVVTLRLVVPRDRPTVEGRAAGVDTIEVACWTPTTQQLVAEAGVNTLVEIEGVLRRRFFRAGSGPASRYEVEAREVRSMPAAAPVEQPANPCT